MKIMSNLLKLLSGPGKSNPLKGFNKEIEIQIKDLITKSKISLSNFNLIGLIEKGKFNKLSAKSEFEKGKYLDITLKKDLNKIGNILKRGSNGLTWKSHGIDMFISDARSTVNEASNTLNTSM